MEADFVKLKEIKPVLTGYIRKSQNLLKKSKVPDDKVIHDVRVMMKKSRAVLKLTGPNLGNDFFKLDIAAFKEVSGLLCTLRDLTVQKKLLKEIKKEYPDLFNKLSDYEPIAAMLKKSEVVVDAKEEIVSGLDKINELLNKAEHRIRFQTISNIDPHLHLKELEVSFFEVMHSYIKCRNQVKPNEIHEFRKRVKTFLYQLYYFRPLNQNVIKGLEKNLDGIAHNLGKYNDLTQLIVTLGYKYPDKNTPAALDELVIRIRERQDKFLLKVWPQAYKIFCPGQNLVNVLGFKLLVI